MTPSQLARKRANDREAQRAIRARTKEHIERLEKELEELKDRHSRDETVQELLKRNKALERELVTLKESLGIQGRPYSMPGRDMPHVSGAYATDPRLAGTAGYEGGLPAHESSRPSTFGQNSAATEYGSSTGAFGSSYLPTPEPCESWSSAGPPISTTSVPSLVSSPTSSVGNPEEYVQGYIPTSVPPSVMDTTAVNHPTIPCLGGNKAEYDDVDSGKAQPWGWGVCGAELTIVGRSKLHSHTHLSCVDDVFTTAAIMVDVPPWYILSAVSCALNRPLKGKARRD